MKKFHLLWIVSIPVISLLHSGFLLFAQESKPAPSITEIAIIHTNDIHSVFFSNPEPLLGLIKRLKEQNPNSILLDAGDMFDKLVPQTAIKKGKPISHFLNDAGYDGITLGDNDIQALSRKDFNDFIEKLHFPVLSANLFHQKDSTPVTLPYWVYQREGVNIGVLGIYGEEPLTPDWITISDPLTIVKHYAKHLRARVDCLVILSHSGLQQDKKLAEKVPDIDVIVGGASHSALFQPEIIGKTTIVQTGAYGKNVGLVRLRVDREKHQVLESNARLFSATDELQPF